MGLICVGGWVVGWVVLVVWGWGCGCGVGGGEETGQDAGMLSWVPGSYGYGCGALGPIPLGVPGRV